MDTAILNLPPVLELQVDLTDEQFFQLCQNNPDLRFERTAQGELIIMPPTGGDTSDRNADLTYQLRGWSRQNNLGKSFDSSGGFKLPNGANRSPDASWLKMSQSKMQEYINNGARLGWLIDPKRQVVEIYRPNQAVEVLQSPKTLSGEDVLPRFVLDLLPIL
jgi:Uma2 family endonuclease